MFLIIFSLFPPIRNAREFGFGNIYNFPEKDFSATYQNLYSLPELQTVKINWLIDSYGFGFSHFGSSLYRESKIKGILLKEIEKTIFIIEPSIIYLLQNKKDNFGFSADFLIGLSIENYEVYLKAFNSISWIKSSSIPSEMEVCGFYSDEWNKVGVKINFTENWGIGLGFGYEIKFPTFNASLGLLTNPLIPTMGFSFDFSRIKFAIGVQNHTDLGLSETITISYLKGN